MNQRYRSLCQSTMTVLAMFCLFGGLFLLIYIGWHVERYFHYKWGYKDMVQKTVREMVKSEALKPCPHPKTARQRR